MPRKGGRTPARRRLTDAGRGTRCPASHPQRRRSPRAPGPAAPAAGGPHTQHDQAGTPLGTDDEPERRRPGRAARPSSGSTARSTRRAGPARPSGRGQEEGGRPGPGGRCGLPSFGRNHDQQAAKARERQHLRRGERPPQGGGRQHDQREAEPGQRPVGTEPLQQGWNGQGSTIRGNARRPRTASCRAARGPAAAGFPRRRRWSRTADPRRPGSPGRVSATAVRTRSAPARGRSAPPGAGQELVGPESTGVLHIVPSGSRGSWRSTRMPSKEVVAPDSTTPGYASRVRRSRRDGSGSDGSAARPR